MTGYRTESKMIIEIGFDKPQNYKMGDRISLIVNGNLRMWTVAGWNMAKTSIIFSSKWD